MCAFDGQTASKGRVYRSESMTLLLGRWQARPIRTQYAGARVRRCARTPVRAYAGARARRCARTPVRAYAGYAQFRFAPIVRD